MYHNWSYSDIASAVVCICIDRNGKYEPGRHSAVELTEGYELYARDVNWNNIIINKQDEHVREKQDQAYEPGIGYAVCENVKYYFVQKEKALIGDRMDTYRFTGIFRQHPQNLITPVFDVFLQ